MKKHTLTFEPDFDFKLLALVTPLRGFKLCWLLEKKLSIRLQRTEDLTLHSKRTKQTSYFQVFESGEEDGELHFTIFGNKTSSGFLIPEQKVVDYYLKIEGDTTSPSFKKLIENVVNIPEIQHGFEVEPESLKSKQNFIL